MCTQERTGDEIDTDLTRRLGIDGAAAAWVGGRRQSQSQHGDRQHFEPKAQGRDGLEQRCSTTAAAAGVSTHGSRPADPERLPARSDTKGNDGCTWVDEAI
jgi:hypothetical protein